MCVSVCVFVVACACTSHTLARVARAHSPALAPVWLLYHPSHKMYIANINFDRNDTPYGMSPRRSNSQTHLVWDVFIAQIVSFVFRLTFLLLCFFFVLFGARIIGFNI